MTRQPAALLRTVRTPIGAVSIAATELGVLSCDFGTTAGATRRLAEAGVPIDPASDGSALAVLALAERELGEYFAGTRREFTVPVDLRLAGSFDRDVLGALDAVGYGATTSYGRLGTGLGLPAAMVRGVGQALGRNPVLIFVPCHRVLGADGSLTGYAGGLPAKRWLLDLESDLPQLDLAF